MTHLNGNVCPNCKCSQCICQVRAPTLNHPCKQTCSGWRQGYECGLAEGAEKLEHLQAQLSAQAAESARLRSFLRTIAGISKGQLSFAAIAGAAHGCATESLSIPASEAEQRHTAYLERVGRLVEAAQNVRAGIYPERNGIPQLEKALAEFQKEPS